jgi:hypothetical protein
MVILRLPSACPPAAAARMPPRPADGLCVDPAVTRVRRSTCLPFTHHSHARVGIGFPAPHAFNLHLFLLPVPSPTGYLVISRPPNPSRHVSTTSPASNNMHGTPVHAFFTPLSLLFTYHTYTKRLIESIENTCNIRVIK